MGLLPRRSSLSRSSKSSNSKPLSRHPIRRHRRPKREPVRCRCDGPSSCHCRRARPKAQHDGTPAELFRLPLKGARLGSMRLNGTLCSVSRWFLDLCEEQHGPRSPKRKLANGARSPGAPGRWASACLTRLPERGSTDTPICWRNGRQSGRREPSHQAALSRNQLCDAPNRNSFSTLTSLSADQADAVHWVVRLTIGPSRD